MMDSHLNTLPPTWPFVSLGSICEVGAGNGAPQGDLYFAGGVYPFVRMQDVGRCQIPFIKETADRLNDLALEKHNLRKWPAGSLLIPKSGASVALNKRALLSEPAYVVSHLAVLVPGPLIIPEYLYYLTCTMDMMRLALDPAYPSLRTSDLAKLRIPLPPLSEQQRIVETLQEAEEIRRLRAEAEAKTAELIPAIFQGLFGEIGSNSKNWSVVPISSFVASFQGGKSLTGIEGDFDPSRPRVLKISAVTSGFLVPSESKALPSNYEPPVEHFVRPGDLLITRANTEELVGATALVDKRCPANLVLPDKIWRFVWKDEFEGTPEFIWALFQQKATRRTLGNIASGTGGSMKNISMKKLMQMRVIWPPKELQETFSVVLREVQNLCNVSSGDKSVLNLLSSLAAHAFSGKLTADWREAYKEMLVLEAQDRDAIIKGSGILPSYRLRGTIQEMEEIFQDRTEGIYSDLNREQRYLLREIRRMVGGVRYARYFSAQRLSDYISEGSLRKNPQAIEGHLSVFAARGLIIPVSREEQTEDTGEFVFGNAYRLLLEDYEPRENEGEETRIGDHSRLIELERLAAQVKKERAVS